MHTIMQISITYASNLHNLC